jgi:hypothetical protein
MITAEAVHGIVGFQANGLPVVSLYCRVDPGASQREVRARVDRLLDQTRPLAKERDLDHRYRLSVRADIERIKDALDSERWPPGTIAIFSCKAGNTGTCAEDRFQNRVDERSKRHFRRVAQVIDQLLRTDGYDVRHRDRRLGQADRRGPRARGVPHGGEAAVPAPGAGGRRQPVMSTASHGS